jgi:hypothetical protein
LVLAGFLMPRLLLLILLPAAAALDFYVSPAGSDSTGTGSASSPWASPFPALPAIAAAKANGALPSDVTVHLDSGTYFLPSTLIVTPAAGGDGTRTVTISGPADPAAPPAVLSGGFPIPAWAPAPGAAGMFTAPLPRGVGFVRQMWDAASGARLLLARRLAFALPFALSFALWPRAAAQLVLRRAIAMARAALMVLRPRLGDAQRRRRAILVLGQRRRLEQAVAERGQRHAKCVRLHAEPAGEVGRRRRRRAARQEAELGGNALGDVEPEQHGPGRHPAHGFRETIRPADGGRRVQLVLARRAELQRDQAGRGQRWGLDVAR